MKVSECHMSSSGIRCSHTRVPCGSIGAERVNKQKVVMATIRMDNINDSLTKTFMAFVDVRSAANLIRVI